MNVETDYYESFWNEESGSTIECPYCHKEWQPTYEDTYIGDEPVECYEEGEQTFTCDQCGKKFKLRTEMDWIYTTETIDGEMTVEEWEKDLGR